MLPSTDVSVRSTLNQSVTPSPSPKFYSPPKCYSSHWCFPPLINPPPYRVHSSQVLVTKSLVLICSHRSLTFFFRDYCRTLQAATRKTSEEYSLVTITRTRCMLWALLHVNSCQQKALSRISRLLHRTFQEVMCLPVLCCSPVPAVLWKRIAQWNCPFQPYCLPVNPYLTGYAGASFSLSWQTPSLTGCHLTHHRLDAESALVLCILFIHLKFPLVFVLLWIALTLSPMFQGWKAAVSFSQVSKTTHTFLKRSVKGFCRPISR